MTDSLANKTCIPCAGGVPPLTPEQQSPLLAQLDPAWKTVDHHHLVRAFSFEEFVDALAFTNRVGAIAEEQWHHPDILVAWGKAEIWKNTFS